VNVEAELTELRRKVQHLEDRAAILDCIAAHARGCDRHDVDLLTSTYHDDGVDEHGTTINPGPDYAAWANSVHAVTSQTHLHNITTHSCEIDGDEAHAESYVLVTMLTPDGRTATVMCGRYLDRLERRDDTWRLAVRRATVELAFTADASLLASKFFKDQSYIKGTRDRTDPSYERPLSLENGSARW
jgi:ketosteroid isomerase-like protein